MDYYIFDTETTGLEPPIGVVEVTYLPIREIVPHEDYILGEPVTRLVNPELPISSEASEKHGIYQEDIDREKPPVLADIPFPTEPLIFIAHNVPFDLPLLQHRLDVRGSLCTLQLARRLLPCAPNHKLETLVKYLELEGDPNHMAEADTESCALLLDWFLCKLKMSVMEAVAWTAKPMRFSVMPWGKHRDKPLDDMPIGYLLWLNDQSLDTDMRFTVDETLKRRVGRK